MPTHYDPISRAIRTGCILAVCLGMIAISGVIHLQWITFIPDPWFSPDSTTYLGPALNLLAKAPFNLDFIRTPGYPLFLWASLKIFNGLPSINVIQHLLLLLTAGLSAFLAYHWIKRSPLLFIFVFFAVSLMPWSFVASHRLLTETLYTFFELLVITFFTLSIEKRKPLLWGITGILTMAAVFVRPTGVILFAAFISFFGIYFRKIVTIKFALVLWGLPIIVLSILWCTVNLTTKGYWGFTRFTGRTLFCRVAYLLEPDRLENPQLAALLRPFYHPFNSNLYDPNWVLLNEAGIVVAIQRKGLFQSNEDDALRRLAWRAIATHPFRAVVDHIRRSAYFYQTMYRIPPGYMSPIPETLNSIEEYKRFAQKYPQVEEFSAFARSSPEKYIFNMSRQAMFPLQPGDWISRLCWPLRRLEVWIPVLLFFSLVFLGLCKRDALFNLLVLIGFFHILAASLVTWDGHPIIQRLAVPIEPLCLLLMGRALFYAAELVSVRNSLIKKRSLIT